VGSLAGPHLRSPVGLMAQLGSDPIRAAIVYGTPVVQAGLRTLLEKQRGITVVLEVGKDDRLADLFTEDGTVAVALVVACTPFKEVRERVCWLRRALGVPVLVYGEMTDPIADTLVEEGVCGLLPPDVEADELHRACRVASAGGYHANPWTMGRLRKDKRARKGARKADDLTPKQLEAWRCFRAGLSLKETAVKMKIKPRGVETHRDAMFDKFGVRKISGVINEGIKRGVS
jgi:DNA-binding NarL/FixJ family response regulator